MTSICNYSHPEQQITTGLIRQTSGTLFPYNPEFYSLASGLYGPGTIYCWYLLLTSVIINWSFHAKNDEGYRRPGVSNDLLAALAYPLFAATDALIHGLKFLGTEYRALAIFCLRNPGVELTGFGTFNHTQLDLHDIPPEIVSLGQRAIDLTGPLPICYTFTGVMFVGLLLDINLMEQLHWRPTTWARCLTYGTYAYVVLLMTIFHLSLGDLGISIFLSFSEAIMPFLLFILFALCLLVPLAGLGAIGMLVAALRKRDKKELVEALKSLFSCVFVAVFPGIMLLSVKKNGIPLVPDVGVSLRERDQIAALLGGVTTILFTVWHAFLRLAEKEEKEGDPEELQTLAAHVH
ncbi:hypothetical protein N431DRAFT_426592 [Stipitochalara longipes BDJ]|nr:hypothetical protein N431DRAFT_426592 [Stipitochalara longipes BDJ]